MQLKKKRMWQVRGTKFHKVHTVRISFLHKRKCLLLHRLKKLSGKITNRGIEA